MLNPARSFRIFQGAEGVSSQESGKGHMVCVVPQSRVSGVFQGVLESLSCHLSGSEEFLRSPVDPPADNVQKVSQVEQDKCAGQSGHIRAPLAEPQGGTTQGAYWRPLSLSPHPLIPSRSCWVSGWWWWEDLLQGGPSG